VYAYEVDTEVLAAVGLVSPHREINSEGDLSPNMSTSYVPRWE